MITNQQYPLTPRIKDKYLECFGNPSNVYKIGRESKKLLDNARKKIADILNCDKDEIVFTSGGTSANNIALFGLAKIYGVEKKEILWILLKESSDIVQQTPSYLIYSLFLPTYFLYV